MARRSKPIHSEVEAFEADMIELMDSVPQTKSDVVQLENDMKALLDDAKPDRNRARTAPKQPESQAEEVTKPAKRKPGRPAKNPKAKPKKGAKSKADPGFRELSARDPVKFRILMGLYDGICPVCGGPVLHINAPETGIYCSEACMAAAGQQ